MFFEDWNTNNKYANAKISPSLLWEYDLNTFDWNNMRRIVVERVIKLGNMADYYAAIRLYGGLDKFKQIIRDEVVGLNNADISLVSNVFGLEAKSLYSVKRKEQREKDLGFTPASTWAW